MRIAQDVLYFVYRDGKPFRDFGSKLSALFYLAACSVLDPGCVWQLRTLEVNPDD